MGFAIRFTIFLLAFPSVLGIDTRSEAAMKTRIVRQAGFTVVGIAGRTSNAKETTAEAIISKQWERLRKDALLSRIPNRIDSAIVAVYTDYAGDKDGEYTYVLGARVSSEDHVPAGMVAKKVPAGSYAVFTSEKVRWGKLYGKHGNKSGLYQNHAPEAIAPTQLISKSTTKEQQIRIGRRLTYMLGLTSADPASFQRSTLRSRSAFAITETELKLMAAAAKIGLSSQPNTGYKAPAASGTPIVL